MKRPQTKFHADTIWATPMLLGQKSQNLSSGQNFLQHSFFSLSILYKNYNSRHWHFLPVRLKFWHNTGCFAISDVIMLFCQLLDDWKYAKRVSTWCWSITMQNLLSDGRRFVATGYFYCVSGLIFVYGLLLIVSLGLSHFWFLCHFNTKKIFNLSVWFLMYTLYFAFQLQMQEIDR